MDSRTPKQIYNALLAKKLINEFRNRNMDGFYCETKEEILKTALSMIDKEALISCGGSATLNEIGLIEALKAGGYNFLDPNAPQGSREKEKVAHEALGADYYFMGCNAIAQTGELINADGIGNRVAALIFGPKNIIIIAGLNKVEPNLDAAILRVKTKAAQMIMLKFKRDFEDFDSLARAAEGAASHLVVTSMSTVKGRVRIILADEELGY